MPDAKKGQTRYEVTEGQLRYFAAPKAVIAVGDRAAGYQLCQIVFGKSDGSIYVSTPYFGESPGVLAESALPGAIDGPVTLSLYEHGKVSSHLAKFAHHPDGSVHFSQDGKIRTEIRRQSFSLTESIGHLFQLHIYHPEGFDADDPRQRRADRVHLPYLFVDGLPRALLIEAEWRRKQDIIANIHPPGGVSGPLTRVMSRATGQESQVFFLGQPPGWPIQTHVLMLKCHPVPALDTITRPTMIFMGGYDPHELRAEGEKAQHTGVLVAMYPPPDPSDLETLRARIGTVDHIR